MSFQPTPARPAPIRTVGFIGWLRENLFSSVSNSIVTLLVLAFLLSYIPPIVDWAFLSANWTGTDEAQCVKSGACWVFVNAWSYQFFYGTYPEEELWRVHAMLAIMLAVIVASFTLPAQVRLKIAVPAWLVLPILGIALLDGRMLGLPVVSTDLWGGFTLNVFMAAASIIVAFPFSFLWALGRRSTMPFIRTVSTIFIEFFRGVPVLSLFFMGSVMLPLFFEQGTNVDKLIRVWLVLIFFMSGYMARYSVEGFRRFPPVSTKRLIQSDSAFGRKRF